MSHIQLTTKVGKDEFLKIKMPENVRGKNVKVNLDFELVSDFNLENNEPLKGTVINYEQPFEAAVSSQKLDVLK